MSERPPRSQLYRSIRYPGTSSFLQVIRKFKDTRHATDEDKDSSAPIQMKMQPLQKYKTIEIIKSKK